MESSLQDALAQRLIGMADDEIILGHRDSEWSGHAPILEEDIAFSNIALDEMGHAILWYGIVSELRGQDCETYPDQLVFFREANEYRNCQMVELPKGDWAFTIVRQYLFDVYELIQAKMLTESSYKPIADVAGKIYREELYHVRHTSAWMKRLGLGTEESKSRMQKALNEIWPYTKQLFVEGEEDKSLQEAGYFPPKADLEKQWQESVTQMIEESSLQVPNSTAHELSRSEHSQHLVDLVTTMQEVARIDPSASW